jgi:hypothetical protein
MLVDKCSHLIRCAQAEQVPVISYNCPDCGVTLHALRPPIGEEPWDSVVACPSCECIHFRLAHSHCDVEAWSLEQ